MAVFYNADFSQGPRQLLFAINPTTDEATLLLDESFLGTDRSRWRQLADHERFFSESARGSRVPAEARLWLPSLGCGLWVSGD